MTIQEELFALRDAGYAAFQSKLTPNIPAERFIGVRVPEVRKLAKRLWKENACSDFLAALPHTYYDENMLHGLILSEIKDYDACIEQVNRFLPYVDNWAVCDIMSPKVFRKHRQELMHEIRTWSASSEPYTCRFGLEMLMTHFLDDDFQPEYLEISAAVHSDEYYVNMMIAWFFATALAKQWDAAIPYLTGHRLTPWVHRKTIQKAKESFRITEEQKGFLNTLRMR